MVLALAQPGLADLSPKGYPRPVVQNDGPVLLVEDSEDDAILMRHAFDDLRPSRPFHWVNNGNEAILYLCGHRQYSDRARYPMPALMLLDLKLPMQNGFEVLRWLRSYPAFATLPVIVLSDCLDDRIVRRAYELGANSFLSKPHATQRRRELVHALHHYWLSVNVTAPAAIQERSISDNPGAAA